MTDAKKDKPEKPSRDRPDKSGKRDKPEKESKNGKNSKNGKTSKNAKKGRRRGKKLRVLLICHETLVPPLDAKGMSDKEFLDVKTEYDVAAAIEALGHEIQVLGLHDQLTPLRTAVEEWKPHVVFNLLNEFCGKDVYDAHVPAYLELLGVPYTGCNPRGLVLSRDKALSKKIMLYHRIPVPRFVVVPRQHKLRRNAKVIYPAIVKSLNSEGSAGISQSSLVQDEKSLAERVAFVHRELNTDAIVEQFIDGREVYASVLGNRRLTVLPTWEIFLDKMPDDAVRIATSSAKWDLDYQKRHDIRVGRAKDLDPKAEAYIARVAKRICRSLSLDGYIRIDFRLREDGVPFCLEANPNPDIQYGDEIAGAAEAAGIEYEQLIQKVINLGLSRARYE
ncbi:MAG: ATP-grasp domain-containing protein [Myxococcota bacterium]